MTTNPTPLTAEEKQRLARIWDMADASMSQLNAEEDVAFLLCIVRKMELAAQQTTELVAENSRLMNESMDARIKIDSLLFTNKNLQAENERLNKQLATIAKFCKERRTMGAGGCDNLSMERRQGKSEMARQVYLLTLPLEDPTNAR